MAQQLHRRDSAPQVFGGRALLQPRRSLQSGALYIVRVFVLGLDIPPQSRPADGKLKLFASEKNAFLVGNSTLVLDKDYFPAVEIQLEHDTSAVVRGVVLDDHNRSAAGAHVSIPGYPQVAVTDEMGNFVLPAHAADGQIVQVRAQKDRRVGTLSVPAGTPVQLVLRRP